jgi:hypothetical protein
MSTTTSPKPVPETMNNVVEHGIARVTHPIQSTCDICLRKFTFDDYAVQILGINGCWHVLGRKCITTWLYIRNTCPMCRVKLYGSSRPAPPVFSDPEDIRDEMAPASREPQGGRIRPGLTNTSNLPRLDTIDARSASTASLTGDNPIKSRCTSASDLTSVSHYTNQQASPRRRYPAFDFDLDLNQEAQPGSRYSTYGRAISSPLNLAARKQRNHRIMTQIRVAREQREECETMLQESGVYDIRTLQRRIDRLKGDEERLKSQLVDVPAATAPSTTAPKFVASFSMLDANVQEEEDQQPSKCRLGKLTTLFVKMVEKFCY